MGDNPSRQIPDHPVDDKCELLVKAIFDDLPDDPFLQLEAVTSRIDRFRNYATGRLQIALNAYLSEQKPTTLEQKKYISDIINSRLDKLGLSVGYEGQACNFAVSTGGHATHGRFHVTPIGQSAQLLARVNLSDFLPLNLTDRTQRKNITAKWADQVKTDKSAKWENKK